MTIGTRNRVAARCGALRLWVRKHGRETVWTMTGGQWGEHTVREPAYNDRVHAHWSGYVANNGGRVMADNMPGVGR